METTSTYIHKILREAVKKGAQLVHFSVGSRPQIKIGSGYQPIDEAMTENEMVGKMINEILSEKEKEKLAQKKEIVLVKEFDDDLRFRINIYYERSSPAISFYYISIGIRELKEYNFPPAITEFTTANSGLLVIAGSLGAGKTTTAFSFIDEVNRTQARHIVTVEEIIDRIIAGKKSIVEQRQVGKDAVSFKEAVEFCLKEDIDLVYLNGIKEDLGECLVPIMELASGNSRVILELNADSSIEIIERLANLLSKELSESSSRYVLADNLFGIIVQKLIYGRGGEPFLAAEILIASSVVKSYIREGRFQQIESIIQTSRREGMISMEKSISALLDKGKIKREEI